MRLLATIAAAFVLAATASLAGAVAPAHGWYLKSTDAVRDHHLNIFRFPPRSPSFRPCIARTVRLPAGHLLHGAYLVSERHRTDPDLRQAPIIAPVSGTYSWQACRGWNRHEHWYEVRSTLRGHGFSHTILNVIEPRDPLGAPSHLYGNGKYEWGGRIVRDCPGCTHPSG